MKNKIKYFITLSDYSFSEAFEFKDEAGLCEFIGFIQEEYPDVKMAIAYEEY